MLTHAQHANCKFALPNSNIYAPTSRRGFPRACAHICSTNIGLTINRVQRTKFGREPTRPSYMCFWSLPNVLTHRWKCARVFNRMAKGCVCVWMCVCDCVCVYDMLGVVVVVQSPVEVVVMTELAQFCRHANRAHHAHVRTHVEHAQSKTASDKYATNTQLYVVCNVMCTGLGSYRICICQIIKL